MKQILYTLSGLALLLSALPNKTVAFSPNFISRRERQSNVHHLFNILFNQVEQQIDNELATSPLYQPHREALEAAQAIEEEISQSGEDVVHRIVSQEQYDAFMETHSDKLVILSFTSLYCRACKEMQHKFRNLHQDPRFSNVVLGNVLVSNNPHVEDRFTDFVTFHLGVVKVPSLRFFVQGTEVGRSSCDPSGCAWHPIKLNMIGFVRDYEGLVRVSSSVDAMESAAQSKKMEEQEKKMEEQELQRGNVWKLPLRVGKKGDKVKPPEPKMQDGFYVWLYQFVKDRPVERQQPKPQDEAYDWLSRAFNDEA